MTEHGATIAAILIAGIWAASGRAQALGRTDGFTKWIVDPESERVLGCGIVGPGAGELIAVREDIGRHNAVDKVIGSVSQDRWPVGESILMVSGRVSFEMVQKAAVAGVPIICGVSAASSLAADLGEELGATVVGFLRDIHVLGPDGRLLAEEPDAFVRTPEELLGVI